MSVDGKRHETILYVMGMMGLIHNLRYDGCQEKFAIAEKALDEAMDVLLEGLTVQELTRIKKETEMTEPSIYHSQGYNCAEALIKSYNEEHNTDIPISKLLDRAIELLLKEYEKK